MHFSDFTILSDGNISSYPYKSLYINRYLYKVFKLDIVEGEGPEAYNGDVVKFNCVCRRANGYFVFR